MKQVLALSLAAAVALAGCVSDDESTPIVPPAGSTFKALFVPAGGVFPFPNDLFFSGSTDFTVNIPVSDPNDVSDYLVAMNALDGFSTTAPIVVPFNGPIDAVSIDATTVIMVNITGAPTPLTLNTHFTATVSPAVDGTAQLMITPIAPLVPKGRYAIIITRGIESAGVGAIADDSMQLLLDCHGEAVPDCTPPPELATLFGAIAPALDLANGFGVTDANVAVVATFATQSTLDAMALVNTNATAGTLIVTNTGFNTNNLNPGFSGHANVYSGYLALPYYQSRTNLLGAHWLTATGGEVTRYTVAGGAGPAATETLNVPVLVTLPNASSTWGGGATPPGAGWPVVIFQHGITGDRSNVLAIADKLADAGFAVFAIDQPLHGITVTNPAAALRWPNPNPFGVTILERTFDADVSNNATRAPGADGTVDASGQNYINLSSLLTSRDNLRQSAADLIRLVKSIPGASYLGTSGGAFDASRIHFVGHSLGGIVGTTFLGVNTDAQAATLGMPGGTIARLLRDSPTFSVSVNAGLAANGVVAGTQLYEQFMQAAQTVVDSGDPINFAVAANANHALHLIQVVGTSAATQDQVVPNSATGRLIAALGLAKISATGGPDSYVNFTAGNHSSLLSPAGSGAAYLEMQNQVASFMSSDGATITISDGTVIEP